MVSLTILLALATAYWLLTSALTRRARRDVPRLPALDPPEPLHRTRSPRTGTAGREVPRIFGVLALESEPVDPRL